MFKRKKRASSANDAEEQEQVAPQLSEDNPMFGGAAVDNHAGENTLGDTAAFEPQKQADEASSQGEADASQRSGRQPADVETDLRNAGSASGAPEEQPATAEEWQEGTAEDFARPHPFEVEADEVPLHEDERDESTGLPFDEDGAFSYDADAEEFGPGDSDSFVDDPQRDYYRYGEKMHGVRKSAQDEAYEANESVIQEEHAEAEVDDELAAKEAAEQRRGKHRKPSKKEQLEAAPEHVRKSHRTRRVLIIVIIVLVAVLAAIGYWAVSLYQVNNSTAVQQVDDTTTDVDAVSSDSSSGNDSSNENAKVTEVPALVSLMGLTQDEAITTLGHGALATVSTPVSEEGNPVVTSVTVPLNDEPADSKSGTPTVYLGLNADGVVVQAGYSAATASLGYGNFSFVDIINNEHVVENTLNDAGLSVDVGSVEAPEDKLSYTTYASDGKTVTSEKYSFDGSSTAGGANYSWSAAVAYDYTAANASGNLADTVRQITVYITAA